MIRGSSQQPGVFMFWPFLAAAAIATALIKLGALSVMVSVLSLALKVAVVAALVAVVLFLLGRINKA